MDARPVEVWDAFRSRRLATGTARPWGGSVTGYEVMLSEVELDCPATLVFADGPSIDVTIARAVGAAPGQHDAMLRD